MPLRFETVDKRSLLQRKLYAEGFFNVFDRGKYTNFHFFFEAIKRNVIFFYS